MLSYCRGTSQGSFGFRSPPEAHMTKPALPSVSPAHGSSSHPTLKAPPNLNFLEIKTKQSSFQRGDKKQGRGRGGMPSAALQQHLAAPHNYSFNSTSSFPPNYCPAVGARRFESSRDFCFACTDDMQTPRYRAPVPGPAHSSHCPRLCPSTAHHQTWAQSGSGRARGWL